MLGKWKESKWFIVVSFSSTSMPLPAYLFLAVKGGVTAIVVERDEGR